MKTASLVLGIIGGILAIIFAIVSMAGGALVNVGTDYVNQLGDQLEADGWTVDDGGAADLSASAGTLASWLYIAGVAGIVGGVLGIVGGAMTKNKNMVAGILLIVAAILSSLTVIGIIAGVLLLIGGILALVSGKSAAPAAA